MGLRPGTPFANFVISQHQRKSRPAILDAARSGPLSWATRQHPLTLQTAWREPVMMRHPTTESLAPASTSDPPPARPKAAGNAS